MCSNSYNVITVRIRNCMQFPDIPPRTFCFFFLSRRRLNGSNCAQRSGRPILTGQFRQNIFCRLSTKIKIYIHIHLFIHSTYVCNIYVH